jgi:hypothetical protein
MGDMCDSLVGTYLTCPGRPSGAMDASQPLPTTSCQESRTPHRFGEHPGFSSTMVSRRKPAEAALDVTSHRMTASCPPWPVTPSRLEFTNPETALCRPPLRARAGHAGRSRGHHGTKGFSSFSRSARHSPIPDCSDHLKPSGTTRVEPAARHKSRRSLRKPSGDRSPGLFHPRHDSASINQ